MSTANITARPNPRAWSRRWVFALAGLALIAASCSNDSTSQPDPAAPGDTTMTTTSTSIAPGTQASTAEPAGLTLDDYLVAIINADADVGACGQKAEEDFNAQRDDDERTEAEAVAGSKEYFRGQLDCQQGAVDAIAALQPPPEAAAAHADLVAARRAWQAAARAETDEAETMDEINRSIFEPGPAVVEAYGGG